MIHTNKPRSLRKEEDPNKNFTKPILEISENQIGNPEEQASEQMIWVRVLDNPISVKKKKKKEVERKIER